jgi:DNA-binding NarL/FixJ family response regulator
MSSAQRLRVFVADDHVIVRQGLKTILQESFEVVGEASDGHNAIRVCRTVQPDIAILDVGMPLLNGIDAAREIRKCCPNIKVILLTMYGEESYVVAGLRAGITGYVLKSNAFSSLLQAIEAVTRNETYLSPGVTGGVLKAYSSQTAPPSDPLSIREREVLQLLAEGKNVKEVGDILGISAKTAEAHRGRVMRKLGIFNLAGLVRYALKRGLVIERNENLENTRFPLTDDGKA